MISRRKFLWGLGASGVAATLPWATSLFIEKTRRRISLWNDGGLAVRIGHLSDLHFSRHISLSHIRDGIDLVLGERPDVVCVTGDFITAAAPDPDGYVKELKKLSTACPTFACMGNHDGGDWSAMHGGPATPDAMAELLHAAGIRVLQDETERITVRNRSMLITGVNDLWSRIIHPKKAGFGNEKSPRIVLAHNPDTKDALADESWDLMLSGHTHGGQIRVPFFGGRLTAPVKDDRYIEGLLSWGQRQIHISRGVGSLYGLRINCPPEVTLLEIG